MKDIAPELRKLLTQARKDGRTLKSITDEAQVGYFKIHNWMSGRSPVLDISVAERVYRVLTGEGFVR